MKPNYRTTGWFAVGLSLAISAWMAYLFIPMWKDDVILPGQGVTQVKWLSDYAPGLRGTLGDTRVFILEGKEPGANILQLSGHHADEPGGWMSSMIVIEHAKVGKGKLVVIPQANNSSFTHNYPQEAHAQFITIDRPDGKPRVYRHGSRTANSAEHWPDPEVFIQYPSGQKLSGDEVRNLNRAYPGRLDGTFSERVAYGIQMVVRSEEINLQIDMHEAQPEYPFVNAASAHPRAQDIVSLAAIGMQAHDLDLSVEVSPATFRGLSNRELPDVVPGLMAVVMETVNAEQGKIRGITDARLPVEGKDAFYGAAAKFGNLFVPWDENGWPLKRRVGRHLTAVLELAKAYEETENKPFEVEGIPSYEEVVANDVGHYLSPPPAATVESTGFRALPGVWRLLTQK